MYSSVIVIKSLIY